MSPACVYIYTYTYRIFLFICIYNNNNNNKSKYVSQQHPQIDYKNEDHLPFLTGSSVVPVIAGWGYPKHRHRAGCSQWHALPLGLEHLVKLRIVVGNYPKNGPHFSRLERSRKPAGWAIYVVPTPDCQFTKCTLSNSFCSGWFWISQLMLLFDVSLILPAHGHPQVVSPAARIWRSWGKPLASPPGWWKAWQTSRPAILGPWWNFRKLMLKEHGKSQVKIFKKSSKAQF